jgi:uncharacterized protein
VRAERAVVVRTAAGRMVCERCAIADRARTRLVGLLGRRELPPGHGLMLRPASSIHMLFMRFAIDALFLDAEGTVLRIAPGLRPWRLSSSRGARAVLELAAGECARRGVEAGDRLELSPIPATS